MIYYCRLEKEPSQNLDVPRSTFTLYYLPICPSCNPCQLMLSDNDVNAQSCQKMLVWATFYALQQHTLMWITRHIPLAPLTQTWHTCNSTGCQKLETPTSRVYDYRICWMFSCFCSLLATLLTRPKVSLSSQDARVTTKIRVMSLISVVKCFLDCSVMRCVYTE